MKKMLTVLLAVSLLFTLSVTLWAGSSDEVVEAPEPEFEGLTPVNIGVGEFEVGKKGGTFIMTSFGSDPKTFNEGVAKETSTTDITTQMYSSLFRRNQFTLEWENSLADSYEIADDELSITVTLKKGLKWSDGQPITADDIIFSVNEIHLVDETTSRYKSGLFVGEEPTVWEKVDDLTIKMTVPEVYADLFSMVSTLIFPKHVFEPLFEKSGPEAFGSAWGVDTDVTQVLSSGPFVITEYVPSQKVVMGPNPYYWEKDAKGNQLPYIDEFVYLLVEDRDTELEKFLAGETDYYGLRGEDFAVLVDKKEELDMDIYSVGPSTSSNFVTVNQNPKEGEDDGGITAPQLTWLSNLKFRQALAHLVDRETIINNVVYGFGYPQYSFVPSTSPFYWDGAEDAALKFDPEAAKALLDEIGYKDTDGDGFREDTEGNKIALVLNTNSGNNVRETIGEMLAQEAKKVGLDITFKPEDFNSLVTKLVATFDWELIIIGLTGVVDPGLSNSTQPSYGELHMIEPNQESPRRDWEKELDAIWVAQQTTTDFEKRKAGLIEAQKIWNEQLPLIYSFNAAVMHAYKNKWGNIYPQPLNGYSWDGILANLYLK